MKYLIDTNVLSEARRPQGDAAVKAWLRRQVPDHMAVSVITVLEIDVGIRRLRRRDPVAADRLRQWLDGQVVTAFSGRVLPLDLTCVRHIAPLHVPDPAPEHDAIIAGTALAHGLTVVTRNIGDFVRAGVALVNPWEADDDPALGPAGLAPPGVASGERSAGAALPSTVVGSPRPKRGAGSERGRPASDSAKSD